MIYRRVETVGNSSVEHVVTGEYEEVLAIFTELQAKDAVEYHVNFENARNDINQ